MDQVRERILVTHYRLRTGQVYVEWIKRDILVHDKGHPQGMGKREVEAFLGALAVELCERGNANPGVVRLALHVQRGAGHRMALAGQTVQKMLTQAGGFRNMGMLEGARFKHTQAFHNGKRSAVATCREGHDFPQLEYLEADTKSLQSCFSSKPFAPMLKRKTPPDLNAGRERQSRRWCVQADKANKLSCGFAFGSPKAPPTLLDK